MRCVSLTLTGLISAWRRGEASSAILAKPLSDYVAVLCLRQCKSRHLKVCEILKKYMLLSNKLNNLHSWLRCAFWCCEWRRPHVLLLFVSSSNFSSTKLEDLPDDKNRSQPTNIVRSLTQAIISFIFVGIYAPKATFSVLWIERT